MTMTRRTSIKLMGAAVATALPVRAFAASHGGTTHEVQMVNKDPESGERFAFSPDIIRAEPGDMIRFVATDRGHNSVSNKDMLPDGAESWKGAIGKDVDVVVEAEGAYGFHCTPHKALGMVGLILVGDVSSNYDVIKEVKQRGKAAARYEDIFARADEMLAGES